jgi:hypothetical protein
MMLPFGDEDNEAALSGNNEDHGDTATTVSEGDCAETGDKQNRMLSNKVNRFIAVFFCKDTKL